MKILCASRLSAVQPMTEKRSSAWLLLLGILWTTIFPMPMAMAQVSPTPPRILVKPKPGADLTPLHAARDTQVLRSFPAIGNLQIVQLPQSATVEVTLAWFQQSGLVEYAEPDFQVQALINPNDPSFTDGTLWGLHNTGQSGGTADADIDAPEAWGIQRTAPNVVVAVIDTGVRFSHQDLAANMWINSGEIAGNLIDDDGNGYVDDVHGIDAVNNSGDPSDVHGHGTHISGIVGAVGNNQVGVVGVAWDVNIMACRFLDSTGDGLISDAIKCLDYARTEGARIINVSWGSPTFDSQALRDAFDSVRLAGIIVTAAAGNSGADNDGPDPLFPASYDLDNIVSTAGTTRNDGLATWSNFGAARVDLGAPGAAIFSCWNGSDSDYRFFDGTSMAAPHVAGACALLWAKYPTDNYLQIINRVFFAVDRIPSLAAKTATGGRLNLQRALTVFPVIGDKLCALGGSGDGWQGYPFLNGGGSQQIFSTTSSIDTTGLQTPAPQAVYRHLQAEGVLTWTAINLSPTATYTVRVHLSSIDFPGWQNVLETLWITNDSLQFDIAPFTPYGSGGFNKAIIKEFPSITPSASGRLWGGMTPTAPGSIAVVSGVEIVINP